MESEDKASNEDHVDISEKKKKKLDPLPPPPKELDLDEFDSKFFAKKALKSNTNATHLNKTSNVSIPPPPPPLNVRPQPPKPTVAAIPPPPPVPKKSTPDEKVSSEATPVQVSSSLEASMVSEKDSIDKTNIQKSISVPTSQLKTPIITNKSLPPQPDLPPLSHLAIRQSSLPVLVVPTASSSDLAKKNNLTLTALFNGLAKTIAPPNNMPSSHIAPRLPPFRSIGKSMMLNWNQINVRFLDDIALEIADPSETDYELNRICGKYSENNHVNNVTDDNNPTSVEQVEEILRDVLLHETDNSYEYKQMDVNDDKIQPDSSKANTSVDSSLKSKNDQIDASNPAQPWLRSIRQVLDTCTENLQQDLHSCPIVTLLVASTNDKYYLECMKELRSVHHLPRPYQSGHYDPNLMKFFFLLLHDNVNGPTDFEEGVALIQMRQAFPNQICAVLRVNSMNVKGDLNTNETLNKEKELLWNPYGINSVFSSRNGILNRDQPCGQALSDADLLNIRRFIATLVADGIIPAMERRIFNLNVAVTKAKRGVTNVLKSFLRKPRDGLPGSGSTFENFSSSFHGSSKTNNNNKTNSSSVVGTGIIKYSYDQIESQIRLLADSLFLMRDYESALSIYRLAKDDYKSDKATVHYASVYEMMALCLHSLDPLGTRHNRELHSAIETALYNYTRGAEEERFLLQQGGGESNPALQSLAKNNPKSVLKTTALGYCNKLATRLCLVISSIQSLYKSRHLETADLLASASSHESPLCAAILLEQSARHYKAANMDKKYAFHLLMAGHMYRSAKVEKHSMRCFTLSLCLYNNTKWKHLFTHLESALAQQLYALGRFEVAMLFYCRLVGYTGVGRNQQKFLQNLLMIFRKNPEAALRATESMRINTGSKIGNNASPSEITLENVALLEIPKMTVPSVIDESVQVSVELLDKDICYEQVGEDDESKIDNDDMETVKNYGSEKTWRDLSYSIEAEIRAANKAVENDDKVNEFLTQNVITEMDEVISSLKLSKKSSNYSNERKIRYRREPILVQLTVTNPMDIQIHLSRLQIVASFEGPSGSTCTNEFKASLKDSSQIKEFKFLCSQYTFTTPDFLSYTGKEINSNEESDDPFFVVNKESIIMQPNEIKKITLAICPLIEGTLLIKGMRWKLFHDLWVYHEFKTLGPLLQETAEHRANRVRAESQLLKSTIIHDMPALAVDVLNAKNDVLQGEICIWTLRFTNLGSAPASNLVMKTNLPWVYVKSALDDEKEHPQVTSNCIGPTGTCIRLLSPKTDPGSAEEGKTNVINPGETVEFDIIVRASGNIDRHELLFLFRYELKSEDEKKDKIQYRYVRKHEVITIRPSLNLTASFMPSYWEKDEYILSVEMTNVRNGENENVNLFLNRLCIVSRYYRVIPIEGQICKNMNLPGSNESVVKVGQQERLSIHYRIIPLKEAQLITSYCPFAQQNDPSCKTIANLSFLCLENAHNLFMSAMRIHEEEQKRKAMEEIEQNQPRSISQIRRANKAVSENASLNSNTNSIVSGDENLIHHPTSLGSLCPIGDDHSSVTLICDWNIYDSDRLVQGQHNLSQLVVRPKSKRKGCPLTITCKHKTNLVHNFSSGPMITDLEITLRNRLIGTSVQFEFSVERQPDYCFVGAQSFSWSLDGGEELSVPLQVIIYSSGIYNLQSVRLAILTQGLKNSYLFPLQWILKVNDL